MIESSNLIHAGVFAVYLGILLVIAGNVRVKMMRNVSTLIQLTVLLLCIDLLVGFFLIEQYYGGSQSAGWIVKSIYVLPVLFLVSLWWMWRTRKLATRDTDQSDA